MSHELLLMFNGDDDAQKLCSTDGSEVTTEVFEALCRSIQDQSSMQMVVDEQQNNASCEENYDKFKDVNCKAANNENVTYSTFATKLDNGCINSTGSSNFTQNINNVTFTSAVNENFNTVVSSENFNANIQGEAYISNFNGKVNVPAISQQTFCVNTSSAATNNESIDNVHTVTKVHFEPSLFTVQNLPQVSTSVNLEQQPNLLMVSTVESLPSVNTQSHPSVSVNSNHSLNSELHPMSADSTYTLNMDSHSILSTNSHLTSIATEKINHSTVSTDCHLASNTTSHSTINTGCHFITSATTHSTVNTDCIFTSNATSHFVVNTDSHSTLSADSHSTLSAESTADINAAAGFDSKDQIKSVEIPDNWQITILGPNGVLSSSAEPLVCSDQGVYQLWECQKCTALFRDKNICEKHIIHFHDFSCNLCNEPFEEKEMLTDHILEHISEFQVLGASPKQKSSNESTSENTCQLGESYTLNSKKGKLNHGKLVSSIKGNAQMNDGKDVVIVDVFSNPFNNSLQSSSVAGKAEFKNKLSFICNICKKECNSQMSFHDHMQQEHSDTEKFFKCELCSITFRSEFSLCNHKAVIHGQTKPKALKKRRKMGEVKYTPNAELKKHRRIQDEFLYPFPCDFCREKYKSSGALLNHIKVHHPNSKVFRCAECPKSFRSKKMLEAHVSEVHEIRRKRCKYCTKSYKSTENLLTHMQEVHIREQSQSYDCDYCSQSFFNDRELRRHMQVHLSSIQVHDCEHCSLTFNTAKELKLHMGIHMEIRDSPDTFDCNWCSRSFGHKENLKIHVKIHHSPMYNELEFN